MVHVTFRCHENGGVGGGGGRLGPESCQRHHQRLQEEPQHVSGVDGEITGQTAAASVTFSGL